jgi:hypothetical protein
MKDIKPHSPHNSNRQETETSGPDGPATENAGMTIITERAVAIGPDGRRCQLIRQRIIETPPDEDQ